MLAFLTAVTAGERAQAQTPSAGAPDTGMALLATTLEVREACDRIAPITCLWGALKDGQLTAPRLPSWFDEAYQARVRVHVNPSSVVYSEALGEFWSKLRGHEFPVVDERAHSVHAHFPSVAFLLLAPIEWQEQQFWTGGVLLISTRTWSPDDVHANQVWDTLKKQLPFRVVAKDSPELKAYAERRVAEERQRYLSLTSVMDVAMLKALIEAYELRDPENLVPKARERLATLESRERQ